MIDMNLKAWAHNVINNPIDEHQLAHAKATQELIEKIKIACEALDKVKHNGCCMVCSESCPACNAHMALAKIRGEYK